MPSQTGSIDLKSQYEARSSAAKVATNYVTKVNDTGITVHPSGTTASRLQINGNGTTIYQNDVDVAFYGATARIGKASSDRVEIDSTNGITIYKGTKKKIQTTTDGMNIYGGDGSSVVGSFGETVILGNADKTHIEIDPYSLSLVDYHDNRNFIVNDLRTINGNTAHVTEKFWSDGRTVDFPLSYFSTSNYWNTSTYTVLVDGEEVESGIPANLDGSINDNSSSGNWDVYKNYDLNYNIPVIKFASSPQDKGIRVIYDTDSDNAKAFTFGTRMSYPDNVGGLSISQGYGVEASGQFSQARGQTSVASGRYSQAEGYDCSAEAEGAYARGFQARAKGKYSTAIGRQVYMDGDYGVAIGKYGGITGSSAQDYVFLVGNGTGWNNPKNAFSIKWDGTVQSSGLLIVGDETTGGEKVKVFGAVNLYAKYNQKNSAIGNAPSANEYHGGVSSFDYSGERDFYSETGHTTADAIYRSFVVRRLNGSTAITNGFYIGIDASGDSYVNFTSDGAAAWRSGLGLGSLATKSSLAAADIPNLAVSKVPGIRRGVVGQTNSVSAGGYKDVSVSFGHTYSSAPTVVVGLNSSSTSSDLGQCSVSVASVNTTGFTARLFNNSGTNRSPGFYWIAIG